MIRKYHNHKPQTNPWHSEEEPRNNHETPVRQTKQSNQLPLPHQDDCKTRMDMNNVQQNIEQLQTLCLVHLTQSSDHYCGLGKLVKGSFNHILTITRTKKNKYKML